MTSGFKKTEVELEVLTDIDMLLMVEKGIRGGICNSVNRYAKADNKYVKDYDQNKESPYKKIIMIKVMKDILKLMLNILKNYMNFTTIYHFYMKE